MCDLSVNYNELIADRFYHWVWFIIQNNNKQSPGMSSPRYTPNYLTAQNGCSILTQSSERDRGPSSSLLSPDPKSVWVTCDGLPQECTISLRKMQRKPACFNLVGFYCWHQYDSNPALVQLWARAGDRDKWVLVTKIRMALLDVWQYFRIQDLEVERVKEIKIRVMENYGDTKTYINKIGLFYINPATLSKQPLHQPQQQPYQSVPSSQQKPQPVPVLPRDKTHSQHHNATPYLLLQKELKKANDSIAALTEEQEAMKKTILQQEKVIIKVQEALRTVLLTVGRLQRVGGGHGEPGVRYEEEQVMEEKKKPEKKQANRYDIQNLKSMLNAFQKQSNPKPNPSKPSSTHKQHSPANNRTDVIKTTSEDDLSEYTHTHYRTSQAQYQLSGKGSSKYHSTAKELDRDREKEREREKGDKARMLERLVKLIELKEKKKLELKKSGAKNSRNKRTSLYQQFEQHQYESNQDDE